MTKKHLLLCLYAIFLSAPALQAQTPQQISYQAVVRIGEQNTPAVNAPCGVRISILQQGENGTAVYVERHTVTTNANGLLTLAIGGGTVQSGSFATVDWANGPYFVKTEIDPNGGANYLITSTTQLLTVPYALHAKTAETVTGNVAFEKITGVPAGFTGNYDDLTNKPDLFSGNYSDLKGSPTLSTVATSGNYSDLTGVPALATVATSGDYNDLKNKPTLGENGFSGSYNDLSNRPNFKDSIATYGFGGNYNELTNKPTLFSGNYSDLTGKPALATVATSGSYNDLLDKPTGGGSFGGNYNELINKPDIKDSIATYGFSGNYNELTNKPALFDGDYNELINKPNIKDSINTYGFNGNYDALTNKPNIKDSITTHGFDGDYDKLTNKPSNISAFNNDKDYVVYDDIRENIVPSGTKEGDMLLWNGDKGWNILPVGQNGQILTIKDGKPTWIDAAANTYEIGDVYLENGAPKGIIADISNDGSAGILISFDEYTNLTWGRKDTFIISTGTAGYENTNVIRAVWNFGATTYPAAYTCVSLGADEWYLPSKEELRKVYDNRAFINTQLQTLGKTPLQANAYWTSSEKDAGNAYLLQFSTEATHFAGTSYEVKKDSALAVRAMRQLSKLELNSRPDNYHLYAVGDVYYEDGQPVGIVYEISDMGLHGNMIDLAERDFPWYESYDEESPAAVFCGATSETDGMLNKSTIENYNIANENDYYPKEYTAFFWESDWYLPAKDEWSAVYAQKNVINAALTGLGVSDYVQLLQFDVSYWTSTEIDAGNAYSVSFETGSAASSSKDTINYARAIRKF